MTPEFYWIAVAAVLIISSARITRLLTFDKFPPIKSVRDWYEEKTEDKSTWSYLGFCVYCMSFWVTLLIVVWADLSGVFDGEAITDSGLWAQFWWITNGAFAASYVAAIFTARDKGEGIDR